MAEKQTSDPFGDLLDHEYDGIREYDNPCPGWWKWVFFLTAVFAPFYFFYFHIGRAGITIEKDHENALANNVRLRFSEIGELKLDRPTLLEYMGKDEWLKVGQSVYDQKCKSCHGEAGCGLVGPNLTDEFYKNVVELDDILTVLTKGAGNGSMPSWNRLHPNEILLVAAFVANMRGENVPGPRGEEGKEIAPWPAPTVEAATDPEDDTAVEAAKQAAGDPESAAPSAAEEAKANDTKGAGDDGTAAAKDAPDGKPAARTNQPPLE